MCLKLTEDHASALDACYRNMLDYERSLNQTAGSTRNLPIVFDVKVKKTNSPRDSAVQLAIWEMSPLQKRQMHEWDSSMPMAGIFVDGNEWSFYLFFEHKNELVSTDC